MLGAIAGDMIGAPYERISTKSKDFNAVVFEFTDDTVLTVAVADWILNDTDSRLWERHLAATSFPV